MAIDRCVMLLLPVFAAVALSSSTPPQCAGPHGKVGPCPKSSVATHCHDAKGQEVLCGTPGAKPAGLKTMKPRADEAPKGGASPHR